MKTSQWFALAFGFLAIGTYFISIDKYDPLSCGFEGEPLTVNDVWCVMQAEMFDPFIYVFNFLGFLFMICGFLEFKKN